MAVTYDFVYELMRAYKNSHLLVNKRMVGAKVSEFLDIPRSYKQIIRDEKGDEQYFQFFEFKVPFYIKREKGIEKYFKRIENFFEGRIIPVSDEEIERYNQYWELPFIGKTIEFLPQNSAMIETPKGEKHYFSLEKGKELPDVFEIMFKPLPYTAGVI